MIKDKLQEKGIDTQDIEIVAFALYHLQATVDIVTIGYIEAAELADYVNCSVQRIRSVITKYNDFFNKVFKGDIEYRGGTRYSSGNGVFGHNGQQAPAGYSKAMIFYKPNKKSSIPT